MKNPKRLPVCPPVIRCECLPKPMGSIQCVQWRVKYADDDERGVLEYRSWDPQWETVGGNVDDWSVVARDIVANDEHQAFHKIDTGQSETSSVQITVFVQGERTQSKPTAVDRKSGV